MQITNLTFINLDNRKDKLQSIRTQLESTPKHIVIHRTPGVLVDKIKILKYPTKNRELSNPIHHRGTVGCFLAHANAIQSLILKRTRYLNRDRSKFSFIMEDDIVINKSFWSTIDSIKEIPDHIDIIFFDNCHHPKNIGVLHEIPRMDANYAGAFCYAIRNNSLYKVHRLLRSVKFFNHVDVMLYNHKKIRTYSYISNIIKVNFDFGSDRLDGFIT